jgi:YebC/PmpR family DNA-binding regulatory protein
MAGHSKWANIKFRKTGQDVKRGKLFTKFIREITSAARSSGDPDTNPRLRTAIDKALAGNMTRDTIERAIKRGIGGEGEQGLEEVRYEGYGPQGVAIMVDCLTNNRNRTVSDVRHAFTKAGGNLGTDGSVAYLFTKQGQIILPEGCNEDTVVNIAIEAGAEDISTHEDGSIEIQVAPTNFFQVKTALEQANIMPAHAEVTMVPANEIALDAETSLTVLKLIDVLEDLDDVQTVYTNAGFSGTAPDDN